MLEEDIKELIDYVTEYVEDTSDDWFRIKVQLVNLFPPKKRSLFSRRHYSTKKHFINDFEKEVMKYWHKKTGIKLKIDKKKLHNPKWKQKPRGWALVKINKKRKREKKKSASAADK